MDLRLASDGRIVVFEANPNPYLAWGEDFAESALEAGIDYNQLIEKILFFALKRGGRM
jgi:D-alanine-D-alanine ligase